MRTNPQTKRANWHDYRSACRYLITLSKSPDIPPLSQIEGDWRFPTGIRGSANTRWSPTGRIIADKLYHIKEIHSALQAEQYVIMPDHVHFLLLVKSTLPDPLGLYIARFKNLINTGSSTTHIFEDGFNDQIVTNKRNLNTIFNYIRSNPYRLAVRRACPDFFTICNAMTIGDTPDSLYGNIHLLHNPFKDQVIVHRTDSDETILSNKERWLHTASNGGVLVSPFIIQREKSVRNDADSSGGKLILISNSPFGDREKPSGRDFELCSKGRLLIIAPSHPMPFGRESCLKMNSLAAILSSN